MSRWFWYEANIITSRAKLFACGGWGGDGGIISFSKLSWWEKIKSSTLKTMACLSYGIHAVAIYIRALKGARLCVIIILTYLSLYISASVTKVVFLMYAATEYVSCLFLTGNNVCPMKFYTYSRVKRQPTIVALKKPSQNNLFTIFSRGPLVITSISNPDLPWWCLLADE